MNYCKLNRTFSRKKSVCTEHWVWFYYINKACEINKYKSKTKTKIFIFGDHHLTNQWYKSNAENTQNKIRKESRIQPSHCCALFWMNILLLTQILQIFLTLFTSWKLVFLRFIQISAENRLNNILFLTREWKISERFFEIYFD